MSRWSILLFVVAAACGGKPKQAPISPLPEDKVVEPVAAPTPPPEEPPAPPPLAPVEVKVAATATTVKLVSAGKGKRAPLRYAAKPDQKQQVEVAMDFAATQTEDGKPTDQIVPTMVLIGEAGATAAEPQGTTAYTLTVSATDARDVVGAQLKADKFKIVLASLAGLVITANLSPNGTTGETTLRIEKPTQLSAEALELLRMTLPAFPVLPAEPVGVGAKWRATTTAKLAEKFDVTHTTDYELVGRTGGTWTIKSKTKVTGKDQDVGDGAKITAIKGSGTATASLVEGALYPTSTSSLQTEFTATGPDKSQLTIALKIGGAITTK